MTLDSAPLFIDVLRLQLPRPRMLRALLELSRTSSGSSAPYPSYYSEYYLDEPGSDEEADLSSGGEETQRGCWEFLHRLQIACAVPRHCYRRGCLGAAGQRCSACRRVVYCGVDCQRRCVVRIASSCMFVLTNFLISRDWREHREICGYRYDITRGRAFVARPSDSVTED